MQQYRGLAASSSADAGGASGGDTGIGSAGGGSTAGGGGDSRSRTGGGGGDRDGNGPMRPRRPLRRPDKRRHLIARINLRTMAKPMTSVVEDWVDMAADIDAINRGEAKRSGNEYMLPNGRVYGEEPSGRAYPISGPGVHQLERPALRALGVYNVHGLTGFAEWMLDQGRIPEKARDAARAAYSANRRR